MAYAIRRANGGWEFRESSLTPRGPRSRTLVTFKELDAGAIAKARRRSASDLSPETLRSVARRAGAPVAMPAPDRAAAALLRALTQGERLSPGIERVLVHALAETDLSDAERAATEWLDASPDRRARALWDLLLLTDRLPPRRRPAVLAFPPLRTGSP